MRCDTTRVQYSHRIDDSRALSNPSGGGGYDHQGREPSTIRSHRGSVGQQIPNGI